MKKKDFNNYDLSKYEKDILKFGIKVLWSNICQYILSSDYNNQGLLSIENLGELYEIGLALCDKNDKKVLGSITFQKM